MPTCFANGQSNSHGNLLWCVWKTGKTQRGVVRSWLFSTNTNYICGTSPCFLHGDFASEKWHQKTAGLGWWRVGWKPHLEPTRYHWWLSATWMCFRTCLMHMFDAFFFHESSCRMCQYVRLTGIAGLGLVHFSHQKMGKRDNRQLRGQTGMWYGTVPRRVAIIWSNLARDIMNRVFGPPFQVAFWKGFFGTPGYRQVYRLVTCISSKRYDGDQWVFKDTQDWLQRVVCWGSAMSGMVIYIL